MIENKFLENDVEDQDIKEETAKPEMNIDEQIDILAAVIIEILLNELNQAT